MSSPLIHMETFFDGSKRYAIFRLGHKMSTPVSSPLSDPPSELDEGPFPRTFKAATSPVVPREVPDRERPPPIVVRKDIPGACKGNDVAVDPAALPSAVEQLGSAESATTNTPTQSPQQDVSRATAQQDTNTPDPDQGTTAQIPPQTECNHPPQQLDPSKWCRPTRDRRRPTRLVEEPLGRPASEDVKKPQKGEKLAKGRKRAVFDLYSDTRSIITSHKSPLGEANLQSVLTSSRAWTGLHPSQQEGLLCLLGGHVKQRAIELGTARADEVVTQIVNSEGFRADVRAFQEDLAAGRLEPKWQSKAAKAMEERASGTMDAWKSAEQESFWGQKFAGGS